MKKVRLILVLAVSVVVGFTSCNDAVIQPNNSFEGTYVGTISFDEGLKSASNLAGGDYDGTADVTDLGDGQIEVHCYGGELDTTFILNHYNNGDSVLVCLAGEAFEEMYGHMMGDSTFAGGMMGGSNGGMMGGTNGGMMSGSVNGNTEWANHMNGDHAAGDEHFGGFNMSDRSFDYTMESTEGTYHFQGTKR